MASNQAILTAFSVLEAAGLPKPKAMDGAGLTPVIEAWRLLTPDVEDGDLLAGAVAYARSAEARFWPTVGQLLACVPARATTDDDADIAWGKLLEHVRRRGWPSPPGHGWELDSQAMAEGLRAVGGWRELCLLEDEAAKAAARASFRSAYRATVSRGRVAIEGVTVRQLMEARGLIAPADLTPGSARMVPPRQRGEKP